VFLLLSSIFAWITSQKKFRGESTWVWTLHLLICSNRSLKSTFIKKPLIHSWLNLLLHGRAGWRIDFEVKCLIFWVISFGCHGDWLSPTIGYKLRERWQFFQHLVLKNLYCISCPCGQFEKNNSPPTVWAILLGWEVDDQIGCIQVDSEIINYVEAMVEVMDLAFDKVYLTIVNPLMCFNG